LAVALVSAVVSAMDEMEFKFINFVAQHGKSYTSTDEYAMRLELFAEMDRQIEEFNASEYHSRHGHNFLSDFTQHERHERLGFIDMKPQDATHKTFEPLGAAPDWTTGWNWVDQGVVSPVKDQGQCGSCWAFSSTGALESAYHIKMNKGSSVPVTQFSEQQLVDCVKSCMGCNGGWQGHSFYYYESHGAYYEQNWPYTSGTTMKAGDCTYVASAASNVTVATYTHVTPNDYVALQQAIFMQPQSISICAETNYFQSYTSGVLTNALLCGTTIDHAVLAVGYGQEDGVDYFLVKNSWSTEWGLNGYVKIAANASNNGMGVCGIQYGPLYPTV